MHLPPIAYPETQHSRACHAPSGWMQRSNNARSREVAAVELDPPSRRGRNKNSAVNQRSRRQIKTQTRRRRTSILNLGDQAPKPKAGFAAHSSLKTRCVRNRVAHRDLAPHVGRRLKRGRKSTVHPRCLQLMLHRNAAPTLPNRTRSLDPQNPCRTSVEQIPRTASARSGQVTPQHILVPRRKRCDRCIHTSATDLQTHLGIHALLCPNLRSGRT